jgi:DNA helicase-2/ATP-dependent DNA helicase PcrA
MTKFFELWSSTEVNLSEFEKFYYEYKNLIQEISEVVGMKCTDMKSNEYNIYFERYIRKVKTI